MIGNETVYDFIASVIFEKGSPFHREIFYNQNFTKETTVKLGYSNIGFCDTLSIASNIQLYELIPHKATVFILCLVRHAQMHQPRM
jgi:hypothetical protein